MRPVAPLLITSVKIPENLWFSTYNRYYPKKEGIASGVVYVGCHFAQVKFMIDIKKAPWLVEPWGFVINLSEYQLQHSH